MLSSFRAIFLMAGLLCAGLVSNAGAQTPPEKSFSTPLLQIDLQALVDRSVQSALTEFASKELGSDQLAVTLVDLRDPEHPVRANYRGQALFYPAGVVELFYLAAAQRRLEDGKLKDTVELRRAMRDMMADSSYEATGYIVDLLTGTTSGPELPPVEIDEWHAKRDAVNRYFASLGFDGINVNKKLWHEGPYGREVQAMKFFKPERNQLTTDATARLLTEIVTGKAVSAERSGMMKEWMRRDVSKTDDLTNPAQEGVPPALPPGAKLWSVAGSAGDVRHDAAYVEMPGGARFVLVVFTAEHAGERGIIPAVARVVVAGMDSAK